MVSNGLQDFMEQISTHFSKTVSTASRTLHAKLFGTTSTGGVAEVLVDGNYDSLLVSPPGDAYTLAYTGSVLDTITRTSDSKVITLGYTGDNLTSVSDWT